MGVREGKDVLREVGEREVLVPLRVGKVVLREVGEREVVVLLLEGKVVLRSDRRRHQEAARHLHRL